MKYLILSVALLLVSSCAEMPNESPIDSLRSVTFSVDMNQAINDDLMPSSGSPTLTLDSTDQFEMIDQDSNGIFSCIIPDLIFGRTYDYQYSINGSPENLNGSRSFTVYDEGNIISDFYGELNPTIVTFLVNMSYQIEQGNFNPDTQTLDVAGTFNDWSGSQLEAIEEDIYSTTITDIEVGDILEFKFRVDGNWDTSEFPGYGANRTYEVQQGNNILEYWYNDEDGN